MLLFARRQTECSIPGHPSNVIRDTVEMLFVATEKKNPLMHATSPLPSLVLSLMAASFVSLHIASHAECLSAAVMWAFEWLFARMAVTVYSQAAWS